MFISDINYNLFKAIWQQRYNIITNKAPSKEEDKNYSEKTETLHTNLIIRHVT